MNNKAKRLILNFETKLKNHKETKFSFKVKTPQGKNTFFK